MKRFFYFLVTAFIAASCQQSELLESTKVSDSTESIRLVQIENGSIRPITESRGISDNSNYALQFSSPKAYEDALSKLKLMNNQERISYIKDLGLISLQDIAQQADIELEQIGSQASTENEFRVLYKQYLEKYTGILIPNSYDSNDLSLYVPDGDNLNTYLVGPSQSLIIGNEVKHLAINQDMSRSDKAVFTPQLSPMGANDVNNFQAILNGSKKTTCSVYFEKPSLFITVSIGMQKKMWYGWKRDNDRDIYYELDATPIVYCFWGPYGNQINISKPDLYLFRRTGKVEHRSGYYSMNSAPKDLTGKIWVWHDILLQGAPQKSYRSVVDGSDFGARTLPTCNHIDEYSCNINGKL